jgi:predicted O-methyltransferase YrrM
MVEFFDAAYPRLRPGGVLLTHNALLLKGETQKLLDATKDNPQVISSVIQIGSDGFAVFYKRLPEAR